MTDYVSLARDVLKSYADIQINLSATQRELEEAERDYKDELAISAKTTSYDATTGGASGSHSSPVENYYFKREKVRNRLDRLRREERELRAAQSCIDNALNNFPETDRGILLMHFCYGKTWVELANEFNMTPKWASIRGNGLLTRFALNLFASKERVVDFHKIVG